MFHGKIVKKITTCMKGPYELFIKIIQVLLKTCLKEINLSLLILGTFSRWLWHHSKLSEVFPIQCYVTYFNTINKCCNLRSQANFIRSNASISQYGLNSMRCFASKMWQMIVVTVSPVSHTYTI